MSIVFMGDVHGKMTNYEFLLHHMIESKRFSDIIQVGDMGIGFPGVTLPTNHSSCRYIHGNHDNPEVCRRDNQFLGRFGRFSLAKGKLSATAVSGGHSIDPTRRVAGLDWFYDEQLSLVEMRDCLTMYTYGPTDIVVSHEAPEPIRSMILRGAAWNEPSQTSNLLTAMWRVHAPKYWIFGHYHRSFRITIGRTHFVGLDELETFVLG